MTERVIVEEGDGKSFKNLPNNFPIGGTEVGTKGLTTQEEELVGDDIGEGSYDVRV
jgi:hypothetical protein